VQVNIGTFASHLQPVYPTTRACPTSAELFRRQLAIPRYPGLSERTSTSLPKRFGRRCRARCGERIGCPALLEVGADGIDDSTEVVVTQTRVDR
jgi:hypothetical protein